MRNTLKKSGLFTLFTFTLILLSQCGQSVCVGPFGDNCYQQQSSGGGSSTGGTIRLTPVYPFVIPGGTVQLTATGGTGIYTYSIQDSGGMSIATTNLSSTGLFTAPTTLSNTVAWVLVKVTDSVNKNAYAAVAVYTPN